MICTALILLAAASILALLQTPAEAAPGDLDTSFNMSGSAVINIFINDVAAGVVVQPDGKIVVAGGVKSGPAQGNQGYFGLLRHNPDGTVDNAFGNGGRVVGPGVPYTDQGQGVALQSNGKILVAGWSLVNPTVSGIDFALVRYNDDGTVDTTFGTNGRVTTAIASGSADDIAYCIAVQNDGKIVVAGTTGNAGANNFALVRYNTDGSLDTTFNVSGKVTTTIGTGTSTAYAVAIQNDGKIVAAGVANGDFALARYNTDGSLDVTFNSTGKVSTDFNSGSDIGSAVVLQSDGNIIVAGTSDGNFALTRYTTSGILDTSFGTGGKVTATSGKANSVALQSNGKIILAGETGSPAKFALARYTTSGMLDTTFGIGGMVTTAIGTGDARGAGVAVQSSGQIIVAGTAYNFVGAGDFAVARYLGDAGANQGIFVKAGSLTIANGDTTPSTLDQTDFGATTVTGGTITRTFTIQNSGTDSLAISAITASGPNAADFAIGTLTPVSPIPAGNIAAFTVTFDPSATGVRSATITINSDDAVAGTYSFSIQGTGANAGVVSIVGNGTTIANGDTTPSLADHTDFGATTVTGGTITRTFTIQNSGTGPLAISGINKSGSQAAEFTLGTLTPVSPIPVGNSATFTVTFDPSATGVRSATITVASDAAAGTFTFSIQGTGANAGVVSIVGNGTTIANGDTTPSLADHTDFGATTVTGGTITRTFTIQNSGTDPLAISGINKSGANAADFAIGNLTPVSPIPAGSSATFTVTFDPSANGIRSATITVASDGGPSTYGFGVQGIEIGSGGVDQSFNPNADNQVRSVAVQPDGKIIIGGDFTSVSGQTRNRIARINADGSLDPGFNPNANDSIDCIAVQPDGKVVIGGSFTDISGQARMRLARFDADGTLDAGFTPSLNSYAYRAIVQNDGKIVIAGDFTAITNGTVTTVRNHIARLNTDGTLDTGFDPNANGLVFGMALLPDGRIAVGGDFTGMSGQARMHLARLFSDGSLDSSFLPDSDLGVDSIAVQLDGKIIIGGIFSSITNAGVAKTRNRIARLNSDGTLDNGFNPNANPNHVLTISLQTDGMIIIGGDFTTVGGSVRNHVARLNADGSLDTAFNPDANIKVWSLSPQADGKIAIGGLFTTIGGFSRSSIARLENDAATQSLTVPNASRVQWLRGGSSPETQQVTFELSTDGAHTWSLLGSGSRIAGGWEKTGLSLPASGQIRARARVTDGHTSSGLVEALTTFSSISSPLLTGMTRLGNGSFQFSFANVGGATFTVLATANVALPLSGWTIIGSATETSPGQYQVIDAAALDFSKRFYMIRFP